MADILPVVAGRVDAALKAQLPFAKYEYVNVTFSLGADTDTDVLYTFTVSDPNDVRYLLINADRSTNLYHDQTPTRKAWQNGRIILRSSAASAVCRLLLFTEY